MTNQSMMVFESIKRINDDNNEFWTTRDMARELGYSEYRHFLPVVEKAKLSCKNSGQSVKNHFEDFLDMIVLGKTASREMIDTKEEKKLSIGENS